MTFNTVAIAKSDSRSKILGESFQFMVDQGIDDYVDLLRKTWPTTNIKRKTCQIAI